MTTVPYVAARRLALARAIAVHVANATKRPWERMPQSERDRMVDEASRYVDSLVASGTLSTFEHEYLEHEAAQPVAAWRK